MTKTFSFIDYIGGDVNNVILNGFSIGIFLAVGYGIYKTLKPGTPETNLGSAESVVRTSKMHVGFDKKVQLDETKKVDSMIKSRISPKSDIGVETASAKTSDQMIQKFDTSELSFFGSELKKRLSQVKNIGEMRELYGDKLVDLYLGTQIGE